MRIIKKPNAGEYPLYSSIYLDLLEDDDHILTHLWANYLQIKKLMYSLPEEKLYSRYAENKWTIKEVLVHLIDDERIFTYRALRNARNDATAVQGFEQDNYATYSNANERSLDSIFEEYESVRKATITLFKYLPEESLLRKGAGIYEDGSIINSRTVSGMAYHIAGHELHHFNSMKEKYLGL